MPLIAGFGMLIHTKSRSTFDLDTKKPLAVAAARGRAKAKALARSNRTAQNYGFFSNCQIWHGKKSKLQIKTLIAL